MTNFFRGEKFSWLPCKKKVADENLHIQRLTKFLVKLQCSIFSSPFLFLKGGLMNFSSPKPWKQVKMKNMIWQKSQVLCRFAWYSWFSYGLTTYNRPKCFPEPSWFNVNVLPTVKWGLLCIVWKSLTQDFCLSIFHWTHSCCCWSCFESSNRVIIHGQLTVQFRVGIF